jgi:UDP-glucose 4-epimerase
MRIAVTAAPAAHGVYGPVHWHGLDLAESTARERLREIFAGCDAVVHLAWALQPTRRSPELLDETTATKVVHWSPTAA